ncbi:MAG: ESPR-type extended signal peptide-containing protein, partial [Negativicoccus succinicivorans]
MNKVYKLIWSKVKNCWVVTSELANSHAKSTSGRAKGSVLAASVLTVLLGSALFPADMVYAADGAAHYVNVAVNTGKTIEARKYPGEAIEESAVDPDANYDAPVDPTINYISIGAEASAWNNGAVAMGFKTIAKGEYATALGTGSAAYSKGDLALGWKAYTGWNEPNKIAIGTESTALKENGISIGTKSKTWYDNAIAIGNEAETGNKGGVTSNDSIAIGNKAKIQGQKNVAIGSEVTVGTGSTSSGSSYVVAIGSESHAYDTDSVVIGGHSEVRENAVVVGNRSKAGMQSVAVGSDIKAGEWSVAIGLSSKAKNHAIAMGYSSEASAVDSVALGNNASAKGLGAIAIGGNYDRPNEGAQAYSGDTIAIGRGSVAGNEEDTATTYNTVAVGREARAYGKNSVALGGTANVGDIWQKQLADGGTAIGSSANAALENATAIGYKSIAYAKDAVTLGANTRADIADGVALGSESTVGRYGRTDIDNAGRYGYDPFDESRKQESPTWKSTKAAVSVGSKEKNITRQIVNVAAGTESTDAVNVAQLKNLKYRAEADLEAAEKRLNKGIQENAGDISNLSTKVAGNTSSINYLKKQRDKDINNLQQSIEGHTTRFVSVNRENTNKTTPNYRNEGATKLGSIAIGVNTAAYGEYAVALGGNSFVRGQSSVIVGDSSDNYTGGHAAKEGQFDQSVILGSNNTIFAQAAKNGGREDKIIGNMNRVEESHGTSVRGTGNFVHNAYNDEALTDEDEQKEWDFLDPTDGGDPRGLFQKGRSHVSVDGDGNLVANAIYTQVSGVGNDISSSDGKSRMSYNIVTGNRNTVADSSHNLIMGDNHELENVNGNIIIGSQKAKTKTEASNVTILGNDANVSEDGGVALGTGSVASTAAEVAGYDPLTGEASTETTATWKSGNGAVSVGTTDKTRQITNLAAGLADTDAVNVAQLKALNTKVDKNAVHYFSVKSDDSKKPAGTNWNNDGASGENAIAIGKDAKAERESSVVIGLKASSGDAANDGVAVGSSASVTGFGGVAIGRESSAEGQETVAIGTGAKGAIHRTVAIGGYANADGFGAVAIGRDSSSKARGVALGNSSFSHAYSVGVGEKAIAEAPYTVAVGDQTASYAMGAVTLGNKTRAFGDSSVAIGNQARVSGKGITPEEYKALSEADQKLYRLYEAIYYNYDDPSKPIVDRKYFKVIDAHDWRAEKHYNSIAIGTTSFVEAKEAIGIGAATRIHGDRGVALGYAAVSEENGTALGAGARANANAGVALGEGAVADTAAEVAGYDPLTGKASTETTSTWKSVKGAVSVGTADATRQITNLAAGTADTDAVNVAQLKNAKTTVEAGDYVTVTQKTEDGKGTTYTVKGPKLTSVDKNLTVTDDKDANDKNIGYKLQLSKTLTGLTSVSSDEFKVGDKTYINSNGINANNNKITNVAAGEADGDAVNFKQLKDVKTKVSANEGNIATNKTNIGNLQKGFIVKDEGAGKANVTLGGDKEPEVTFKAAVDKTTQATENGSSLTSTVDTDRNVTYKLNMNQLKKDLGITEGPGGVMSSWKLKATGGDTTEQDIKNGEAVTFDVVAADKGLTVTRDGKTIKYGIEGSKIDLSGNTSITNLSNEIEKSKIHYFSVKSTATGAGSNYDNDGAKKDGGIAIGKQASATGTSDIAIGTEAEATGGWGVAIGQDTKAQASTAVAMAYGANAKGSNSLAIGVQSEAKTNDSTAYGREAKALGEVALAVGMRAKAEGDHSAVFGAEATTDSTAWNGTAIGRGAYIGKQAADGTTPNIGVSDNYYTPVDDDTVVEPGKETKNSTAVGFGAKSFGYQNTALGAGAEAFDTNTVAVGVMSKAIGHYANAFGKQARAEGKNSTAIGHFARALGESSMALGDYAITSILDGTGKVNQSVALGSHARVAADNSLALGYNSLASIADDVDTEAYLSKEAFKKENGVVSVGNKAYTIGDETIAQNYRRITNVAGGADDNDAVNVLQLKALETKVTGNADNITKGWVLKATSDTGEEKKGKTINNTNNEVTFGVEDDAQGLTVKRTGANVQYGVDKEKLASHITGDVVTNINKGGTAVTNIAAKFSVTDGKNTKAVNLGKDKNNNVTFKGTDGETTVTVGGDNDAPTVTVGLDPKFKKQVADNTADIATNKADIATNKADIATNKADIATNKADIATNKADIATNKADIATNKADIATNKADIATNKADIATN